LKFLACASFLGFTVSSNQKVSNLEDQSFTNTNESIAKGYEHDGGSVGRVIITKSQQDLTVDKYQCNNSKTMNSQGLVNNMNMKKIKNPVVATYARSLNKSSIKSNSTKTNKSKKKNDKPLKKIKFIQMT